MQSVSSNAVYNALETKAPITDGVTDVWLTPRQLNTGATFSSIMEGYFNLGYKMITFTVSWDEYETFPHPGSLGWVIFGKSSSKGLAQLQDYGAAKPNCGGCWTDSFSNWSGWRDI